MLKIYICFFIYVRFQTTTVHLLLMDRSRREKSVAIATMAAEITNNVAMASNVARTSTASVYEVNSSSGEEQKAKKLRRQ